MSDFEEIVAERDGFRVKLIADTYPSEPYNDGGSPILRFEGGYSNDVTQVEKITSYVVPDDILIAAKRLHRDVVPRYLRIFHDAKTVVTWHSGEYLYMTFDSAHWREFIGYKPGYMLPEAPLADMTEWKAYVEGDVYGVVVERSEPAKADRAQLDAVREQTDASATYDQVVAVADMLATDDDNLWVEVDAVWGYYGADYAEEAARETLATYAPPPAAAV